MIFDPTTADFTSDFQHEGMVHVGTSKDRGMDIPVVAYTNEWKGKKKFHIRSLWYDDAKECWCPGKGVNVPIEVAATMCAAIGKLATPVAAPSKVARKVRTA